MHEAAFIDNIKGTHRVNSPGELPPSDLASHEDVAHLRPPPKSIEAEQGVLGAILLDPSMLTKVADILATPDFFARSHRLIFDAIATLAAAGSPVDVVSTFEQLERDGNAGDAGGLKYLNDLAQSVPSAASVRRYAEIVVERSNLRAAIALADQISTRAFKNEPAADILADAKTVLGRLADERKLGPVGLPFLDPLQLREQAHAASWIVKHVVPADSVGMMFGGSGSFKSFIALDLALHIAHGLPWLGRRTKQGAVVIVAAEGGAGMWGRIVAWHKARGLHYEKAPIYVVPVAVDLKTGARRVVETAASKGVKPLLVVVDTFSQTYVGEENSANEVAAYFRAIGDGIRAVLQCAVMVVHHTGHAATERPRGSSVMLANLDWMLGVQRDEKEMMATLSCVKQKDGDRFADTTFSLIAIRLGTDEDGDEVKSLVARHLTSVEEVQEVMERESKAGRGGNNHLFMRLMQNGQKEAELRSAFYAEVGLDTPEARRQAYHRAKSWATKQGFLEVAEGYILTLKTRG